MSILASIRSAIARHGADHTTAQPAPAAPTAPSSGAPLSPAVSPLAPAGAAGAVRATSIPFPSDRGPAGTATPALAAALAAAPGSVSGGASGGMSGGVLGAIPSPRAARLPTDRLLDALADARAAERLDWRHAPGDLLQLLDLESSPASLRQLAEELQCAGDDTAEINAQLRARLAIPHPHGEPLRHAS